MEADFSSTDCIALADTVDEQAVVICADVIEHLLDPRPLVALLAACYQRGAIVITSTPDRLRVRGAEHRGPPPNPSHVREWAIQEYADFLADYSLPAVYVGYTLNNNITRELRTIITIHDAAVDQTPASTADHRPLAIWSAYNEADVIAEVVEDWITQGCDVVAIDNWSTDGTWEILSRLTERYPTRVSRERFPAGGSTGTYEWRHILQRKEAIAHAFLGRWIIHTDADELRRSPFLVSRLRKLSKLLNGPERTG